MIEKIFYVVVTEVETLAWSTTRLHQIFIILL